MEAAAEAERFELAARLRDQIVTVHQMQDKQRMATTDNEDADVFGYHYENEMLAVNLFHMRSGKIVDRRDLFWEELSESLLDTLIEAVDEADELEAVPRMEPDPRPRRRRSEKGSRSCSVRLFRRWVVRSVRRRSSLLC